jgi:hypothetical protein
MKRVMMIMTTTVAATLILLMTRCIFVTPEAFAAINLNSNKSNISKVTDTNTPSNSEETVVNQ